MGCCGGNKSDPAPKTTGASCLQQYNIPLCPPKKSLCPQCPCPNEDPKEKNIRYPQKSEWTNTKKLKSMHDACWCNNWKQGDGAGNPPRDPPPPYKPPYDYSNCPPRQRKVNRDDLFPPPPPNICSYKPCVMNMKAPSCCTPTWTAIPQACAIENNKKYEPGLCTRPGCLHVDVGAENCLYDEPCKASCFFADAYTRPTKYPNGYQGGPVR